MKRIQAIDGLRGIAILIVILFHYLNNSYKSSNFGNLNNLERFIMKFTSFGWAGVNLFFVLSGFLIGTILFSNKNSVNFFQVFYARRFLRILPIYFVLLIVYLLTYYYFFNENLTIFEKYIPIGSYFFLVQNFFMSSLGHFGPNALTPTWSLAVEEQFYLIVPIVIYYLNKKQVLVVSIFFIVFATIYRSISSNWYEEYTHLFSRLDAPFLGIILAISREKHSQYYKLFKNLFIRIFILMGLITLFSCNKSANHLFISVLFLFMIDFVLDHKNKSLINNILTHNWILILGKYSFFIYLFHQLINGLCFAFLQNNSNPNLNSIHSYAIEVLSLSITILLAHFSYLLFESRFIKFGHRLSYKNK